MKSKSGGGLFGIFKKKTTAAPAAPAAPAPSPPNRSTESTSREENSSVATTTESATSSGFPAPAMPPRKGSIAQTSVIHYSPPGTVRASFPPSATSSVVSEDSDENVVVVTRKSNIVLEDEESVISTPVSQYDECPIVEKPRKKRAAPLPPPPPASARTPTSPISPPPHHRQFSQVSRTSSEFAPPPLPPHQQQNGEINGNGMDYEEMLKNLQTKFEQWHVVRLEDGGSIREERIKAQVLREHEKLRILLENELLPGSKNGTASYSNNNNIKKQLPLKIPQYGNIYKPSSPSPPRAVPGGTVYQKMKANPAPVREKPSPPATSSSFSPKSTMDENRNEIQKVQTPNTAAVDRLRREVEEQREREKEVKQYRNPKSLERKEQITVVTSPEPKRKEKRTPPKPPTPQKSPISPVSPVSPGPRMVEYKPMKARLQSVDSEEVAPPIPKTPPPKLAEYRKEQQPRMPTVHQNGYVRLQVGKKAPAPAPSPSSDAPRAPAHVYTGPEYASSPKLMRKVAPAPAPAPEAQMPRKVYATTPVREEIVYQKPSSQAHPQATVSQSPYQKGMLSATSPNKTSSTVFPPKTPSPMMTRAMSTEEKPRSTVPAATSSMIRTISTENKSTTVIQSPIYQKLPQKDEGHYKKSIISATSSPADYRKIPPVQKPTTATVSATSPPYPKGTGPTVITIPPVERTPQATRSAPRVQKPPSTEGFDISDILKGPRLRKVGMPTEKSGISLGKVVDTVAADAPAPSTNRPSSSTQCFYNFLLHGNFPIFRPERQEEKEMADDWGCNVDLFGESNSAEKPVAKSLTELVDSLTKKNMNGARQTVKVTPQEAENVKIVALKKALPTKIGMVHAPKILKKKKGSGGHNNNNNNVLNDANPKRVHFDIEQFLSREASKGDRVEARERMLHALGAAPSKRGYVNYKDLKVERAQKKAEAKAQAEMNHANGLSLLVKKKKSNKKK
ncbi:unnamed protein product [Caenorhabditis sp. 36 PRJEB53466]|nr:unnamed protein product [Caenorhabditis sp. 36 PRJEB53466]